ncbi:MAG TPA: Uma2 family endonuclease [Pyrinomonadaceae bacterium]
MSLPQERVRYTVEEYLEMERASEVRHEYLDGEIFEMSGESLSHGRICTNIVISLGNQLKGKSCDVLSKDTKIQSGWLPLPRRMMRGLFSYPDVIVVCGKPQFHDEYQDILINPNVIIEVLSDATEKFDRGEKFKRYREHLSTLTDYVLVAQDQPFIDHFSRNESGVWTLVSPTGLESNLQVASINCTMSLIDIYDRVEFPIEIDETDESLNAS